MLHKDTYLKNHTDGEKEILCRDASEKPQIEVEADRFAAALLMPSYVVLDAVERKERRSKVSTIGQARGLANNPIKKAGFDNVNFFKQLEFRLDTGSTTDFDE